MSCISMMSKDETLLGIPHSRDSPHSGQTCLDLDFGVDGERIYGLLSRWAALNEPS